jgi:hypothetical protein
MGRDEVMSIISKTRPALSECKLNVNTYTTAYQVGMSDTIIATAVFRATNMTDDLAVLQWC